MPLPSSAKELEVSTISAVLEKKVASCYEVFQVFVATFQV
jgi:hypothetical protein